MTHWYDAFNGVHVTFGVVRGPEEVINDPQLRANEIVVPLEGAGGKLTSTISSPIQVHGVTKVAAKRAPALGEHNQQVLEQLGFTAAKSMASAQRRRAENCRTRGGGRIRPLPNHNAEARSNEHSLHTTCAKEIETWTRH